jgi:hypothetical protein
MVLYSHAPQLKAMNRSTGSIYQIISDMKSISSEKRNASEQLPSTCVDAVVPLLHRDHVSTDYVFLSGKASLHRRLPELRRGHGASWSPVCDRIFLDIMVARLSVDSVEFGKDKNMRAGECKGGG